MKSCSISECINPVFTHGFCKSHSWKYYTDKATKNGKKIAYTRKQKSRLTVAAMKKQLDIIYSPYIRMKYADDKGMVKCVTCPAVKDWRDMQNGHFLARSIAPSIVFNENNCRPQCPRCNIFLNGNYVEYTLYMQSQNAGIVDLLKAQAQQSWKPTAFEMECLIKEYCKKFMVEATRLNHEPTMKEKRILNLYL